MCADKPTQWPGIPCESDGWPFTPDPVDFEARRAVGQVVRTFDGIASYALDDHDPARGEPVLRYLASANVLSSAMLNILNELVAEARARGVTWTAIGKVLDVGGTAAQKRFGKGLTPQQMAAIVDNATTIKLAERITQGSLEGQAEAMIDLEGTTPVDRMRYALDLIRSAINMLNELAAEVRTGNPTHDDMIDKLCSAQDKIFLIAETLLADPTQWIAAIEWSVHTKNPHAVNYHSPATYICYAMHQILLAAAHVSASFIDFKQGLSGINEQIACVMDAKAVLEATAFILMRNDVSTALPATLFPASCYQCGGPVHKP